MLDWEDWHCTHDGKPHDRASVTPTVAWYRYATPFFNQRGHRRSLPILRKESDGGHRIKRALCIGIKRLCPTSLRRGTATVETYMAQSSSIYGQHRTDSDSIGPVSAQFSWNIRDVVVFILIHLPPSAAQMRQWIGSALVQIGSDRWRVAYSAPSHYLNQNTGLLSIVILETNCSGIRIGILSFSFKKMHLKLSSAKTAAILCRERWVNNDINW